MSGVTVALSVRTSSECVGPQTSSSKSVDVASATSSSTPISQPTTPSPSPNSGGGGGPTSSPLLFFVALGFGVVFTNLWFVENYPENIEHIQWRCSAVC